MRYPHSTFVQLMGLSALGSAVLGIALIAARGVPPKDAAIVALAAVTANIAAMLVLMAPARLGKLFRALAACYFHHRYAVAVVFVGMAILVSLVKMVVDRKNWAYWLLLIVALLMSWMMLLVGWLYNLLLQNKSLPTNQQAAGANTYRDERFDN